MPGRDEVKAGALLWYYSRVKGLFIHGVQVNTALQAYTLHALSPALLTYPSKYGHLPSCSSHHIASLALLPSNSK